MDVKIVEITNPNRNAKLVAMKIAQQLQKRGSFRRAIKKTLDEVMSSGVYGVKIQMSGRLGGAEMSRQEKASRGSIPLSTLRRHIDYDCAESATTMGIIGVKVWIDLGDYSNEETADGANAKAGETKDQRGRIRGNANRGNTVVFGEWALRMGLIQVILLARRLKRAESLLRSMFVVKVAFTFAYFLRSR